MTINAVARLHNAVRHFCIEAIAKWHAKYRTE